MNDFMSIARLKSAGIICFADQVTAQMEREPVYYRAFTDALDKVLGSPLEKNLFDQDGSIFRNLALVGFDAEWRDKTTKVAYKIYYARLRDVFLWNVPDRIISEANLKRELELIR